MHKKSVLLTIVVFCLFFFSFKISDAQVVINEFSSSTDNGDWIELFAYEDVDLTYYRLTHLKTDGSEGDINIPAPTNLGPNSVNGQYKVINLNNYLGNDGDRVRLYKIGDSQPKSDIVYGDQGGVCIPTTAGSIARIPDGGNTIDGLLLSTKGYTNGEVITYPCPSPAPVPTNTPTNTPAPTSTPTNTPTPTNSPSSTPTSTPKPSLTPTKKPTPTPKDYTSENQELSADVSQFRYDSSDEAKENAKDVLGVSDEEKENVSPFAYVLLGLGIIFVGVSIFLYIKNKKQ
jgi:hypothetical protein